MYVTTNNKNKIISWNYTKDDIVESVYYNVLEKIAIKLKINNTNYKEQPDYDELSTIIIPTLNLFAYNSGKYFDNDFTDIHFRLVDKFYKNSGAYNQVIEEFPELLENKYDYYYFIKIGKEYKK